MTWTRKKVFEKRSKDNNRRSWGNNRSETTTRNFGITKRSQEQQREIRGSSKRSWGNNKRFGYLLLGGNLVYSGVLYEAIWILSRFLSLYKNLFKQEILAVSSVIKIPVFFRNKFVIHLHIMNVKISISICSIYVVNGRLFEIMVLNVCRNTSFEGVSK